MPYQNEIANPLGHVDLLKDSWIMERLKTYRFSKDYDVSFNILDLLKVATPEELGEPSLLTTAFAVDGSISDYELVSALKIGSVRKDLGLVKLSEPGKPVNPAVLRKPFKLEVGIGLLPGRGVGDRKSKANWHAKLRQEYYQTLKHIKVPGERTGASLLQVIQATLKSYSESHRLKCLTCGEGEIDFPENVTQWECDVCNADVYFSDYTLKPISTGGEQFTTLMLQIERFLLQGSIVGSANGAIPSLDYATTLFIGDGALQFYGQQEMSGEVRAELQALPSTPLLVSFLKSGHMEKLFKKSEIGDYLLPGQVGMVTDELRKEIAGNPKSAGVYGKSFAYRTKRGDKYFAFNTLPAKGPAHALSDDDLLADEWGNYPQLPTICAFIESDATDVNGFSEASLTIVGEANRTASLPFHAAKAALESIVTDARK